MVPEKSAHFVTRDQAAEEAGVSNSCVENAIRGGKLVASLNEEGTTVISRAALDRWIEWRFHEAGGTNDPGRISLKDAAEMANLTRAKFREAMVKTNFTRHTNPAGRLILDRAEFSEWLRKLPPLKATLDSTVRWYKLKEIGAMVSLTEATILLEIKQGRLAGTLCRTPVQAFLVAEPDLRDWLRKRSEKYPQAPLRGERLRVDEAARRYGVSAATLYNGISRGFLPVCRQQHKTMPLCIVGSLDVELGRRWQVSRQSLLEQAANYRSADTMRLATAAVSFKIPHQRLLKAASSGAIPSRRLGEDGYWSVHVRPEDVRKWEKLPLKRKEICKQYQPPPQLSKELYSLSEVAELSRLTVQGPHRAIKSGALVGEVRGRGYVFTRAAVAQWLETHFHQRGGTRQAEMISVTEAARMSGFSVPFLKNEIHRGRLGKHVNPAGKLILDRGDLEKWRQKQAPGPESLAPGIDYWTIVEVADRVNLQPETIWKNICAGSLRATWVSGFAGEEREQAVVAESDLQVWIKKWPSRERRAHRQISSAGPCPP